MGKMALTIKQGFALPKKELPIFNRDPLEYWNFIKSFENSIEANTASESEKLMYLLQYTSGVAKDSIKLFGHGCFHRILEGKDAS